MLVAITLFWCVGVYNRLMRIRARAWDALGSVEKCVRQYTDAAQTHLLMIPVQAHLNEVLPESHLPEGWSRLLAQLHALDLAFKETRTRPLASESLSQLAHGFDNLMQTWQELRDAPADLAGAAIPEALQHQWDAITAKVVSARHGLNQILDKYNAAVAQFPARLLVGLFGFKPAGKL
jgi:LemA protein